MHPLTTPDQSIHFVTERRSRLRSDATDWRRRRRALDATRPTHA